MVVRAASAGGIPDVVSRHISSSIATSSAPSACACPLPAGGSDPYRCSQERTVVGETLWRLATAPVEIPNESAS